MDESKARRGLLIGVVLLCAFTPLLFALLTGQIWEDFFITFRHARNWALGEGLVYQVGERVHGFTSPVNVGLLALFDRLFGAPETHWPALWAYRIVSTACFAGGAFVLARHFLRQGAAAGAVAFFAAAYALQVRGVAYTVNGQEAGFLLLALALGLVAAHEGVGARWKLAGCGWAALLWSRPDGCVLIAILALAGLLLASEPLREQLRGILKATLVCTALYLPWFAGAWIYYGSPVPHTITAKMGMSDLQGGAVVLAQTSLGQILEAGVRSFTPVNFSFGGWPDWVRAFALLLTLAAGSLWLWPAVRNRLARLASLAFLLHALYLGFVLAKAHLMAWYTPPTALLGLVALTAAAPELIARLPRPGLRRAAAWAPAALALLAFLWLFAASVRQLEAQQRIVEDGLRTQLGLWLSTAVADDETVYLEPLGYIGYFSDRRMLDYPGLASPRTVEARRKVGNGLVTVIPELDPDWLVMRPGALGLAGEDPRIRGRYEIVKVFDAREEVNAISVQGHPFLLVDAHFLVLRKR